MQMNDGKNKTHHSIPLRDYDKVKTTQEGEKYTGMSIGARHYWEYPNGKWNETKIGPSEWELEFRAKKRRPIPAPRDSGAKIGTEYHWYIVADQMSIKKDKDSYETIMKGRKFKVGHKRPYWRKFSYEYPEQESYKKKVANYLRKTADLIENGELSLPDIKLE
jgi:hypothetical protein